MAKNCAKCVKSIRGIEFAKCAGFCDKLFHLNCCGLSRPNYEIITLNALWLCEDCRPMMENKTLKDICTTNECPPHFSSLQQQIDEMKQQISVLTDTINACNKSTNASLCLIESKLTKNCSEPETTWVTQPRQPLTPSSALLSQQKAMKRRRIDDVRAVFNPSALGTNETNIDIAAPSLIPVIPPERLWIYLSGFHPLVSTDDLNNVVMKCLKIDEPVDIVKLVPRDKDTSNLTFISFKIGIPPAYKDVALLAETWPKGIRFRQFETRSKNFAPPVLPIN